MSSYSKVRKRDLAVSRERLANELMVANRPTVLFNCCTALPVLPPRKSSSLPLICSLSFLEASGWLGCSTAKFERGEESKAKEITAAVYEKIVADLVDMRGSTDESDVDYSRRATEAILTSFDVESLSYMADIAPSIQRLIPGTGRVSSILCI